MITAVAETIRTQILTVYEPINENPTIKKKGLKIKMEVKLSENVIRLLRDPETVKVLATVDPSGEPHVVFKDSISVDEVGRLFLLELLESSRTNRNLVHSLWFNRKVSVSLRAKQGESYEIKGVTRQCVITGPVFEKYYRLVREGLGDIDLAAVWFLTPEEVRDETFEVRYKEETEAHPLFMHLDRIAKE